MITRYTMSPWLHFPIHRRRPNWHCAGQLLLRYRTARHLLCSSPLPLCPFNRRCICHHSWVCSLIPPTFWVYPKLSLNQSPFPHYICRSKHNLLPPTLSGPVGHTSAIFRLSRCLYNLKYYLLYRLFHFSNSGSINNFHYLRGLRLKTRSTESRNTIHQPRMTSRLPPSLSHI